VRAALEKAGITPLSAELTKVPDNMVKLDEDKAIKVLRLIDELDELDDAQHVYSNLDVSEEVLEKYAKE
jgi:transcriptional/translational regulatory protein YebC/TACO1